MRLDSDGVARVVEVGQARAAGSPPDGFPLSAAVGEALASGLSAAAPLLAEASKLRVFAEQADIRLKAANAEIARLNEKLSIQPLD